MLHLMIGRQDLRIARCGQSLIKSMEHQAWKAGRAGMETTVMYSV